MQKEMIQTGRSVDEAREAAIEAACLEFGISRENCEFEFEIIDLPKKTLFRLKPAKVRVWVELPDEKPAPRQGAQKSAESRKSGHQISHPQQQKRESTSAKAAEAHQQKPAPGRKEPRPIREIKQEKVTGELTAKEQLAKEYISGMLDAMKLENEIEFYREDGGICVKINSAAKAKELGVIIGHRGETLDAIQYLTGLVINRLEGDYQRVTVDCGDYRVKRQETLKELAIRIAEQVRSSDISKTLEPMNPFERRIIHATVSEIEGVHSISVGDEPNRRVVITTPTAKRPAPRRDGDRGGERGGYRGGQSRYDGGRGGDRDRGSRGGRGDRDRRDNRGGGGRGSRPAPQATPDVPKATPEAGFGGDKFGKIDL